MQPRRGVTVLVLLLLPLAAFAVATVVPPPIGAVSPVPQSTLLSDDFTKDTALNASLWEINGPVASVFGENDCGGGCTQVTLVPSFSSTGMEIAQINGSSEEGTIQSVESFAPPLTVVAVVEGTVSNGHPFIFGMTAANGTAGVEITGNLDPKDCSHEGNCGDPTTCGNPANSSIPPNQCYYGIYGKIGTSSGTWVKQRPFLDATPSVGVLYTLQIAINSLGATQYRVSQGGQLLESSTAQVGTGPFYIVLGQSEGAPVPGHGPNQAYWLSSSLTPSANFTVPPPSSSPSGFPFSWLLVLIIVVVVVILLVLVVSRRRRAFTVTVLDSGTLSPVPGAGVSADGPTYLSGGTGSDGKVAFGGVKAGDYSLNAGAVGYHSSVPTTVSIQKGATFTVRLDRIAPGVPEAVAATGPPPPQPPVGARETASLPPGPATAPPRAAPPPPGPVAPEGGEGWGGERIRQIITTFRTKGAVSPETALTAQELGLSRLFVRIMRRRRGKTIIFVEVNGRYYLDQKALQEMEELRGL